MTDIAIIGAGCAGLTSAIYAIRAGLSVKVFEKYIYGGQIAVSSDIQNYPSIEKIAGPELATNLYNHALNLGADIRFEEIVGVELSGKVKKVITNEGEYSARSVIIANGVARRKLGCQGEDEFYGRGVSYCATCDGALYKNKNVAIIGGGNTALEDALYLSNICSAVYLIHRRDTFRGSKILADSVIQRNNIKIVYNATVERIDGDKTVNKLYVKDKITSQTCGLDVSAVFVAIGLAPDNDIFKAVGLDSDGYIKAGEDCTTSLPGVFVAGDTRTKLLRQIITAEADGAVAAFQASNYLNTHSI